MHDSDHVDYLGFPANSVGLKDWQHGRKPLRTSITGSPAHTKSSAYLMAPMSRTLFIDDRWDMIANPPWNHPMNSCTLAPLTDAPVQNTDPSSWSNNSAFCGRCISDQSQDIRSIGDAAIRKHADLYIKIAFRHRAYSSRGAKIRLESISRLREIAFWLVCKCTSIDSRCRHIAHKVIYEAVDM